MVDTRLQSVLIVFTFSFIVFDFQATVIQSSRTNGWKILTCFPINNPLLFAMLYCFHIPAAEALRIMIVL